MLHHPILKSTVFCMLCEAPKTATKPALGVDRKQGGFRYRWRATRCAAPVWCPCRGLDAALTVQLQVQLFAIGGVVPDARRRSEGARSACSIAPSRPEPFSHRRRRRSGAEKNSSEADAYIHGRNEQIFGLKSHVPLGLNRLNPTTRAAHDTAP